MRCKYCGTDNSSKNTYCSKCGRPLHAGREEAENISYHAEKTGNLKIVLVAALSFCAVFLLVTIIWSGLNIAESIDTQEIIMQDLHADRLASSMTESGAMEHTDPPVSPMTETQLAAQTERQKETASVEEIESMKDLILKCDCLGIKYIVSDYYQEEIDELTDYLKDAVEQKDVSEKVVFEEQYKDLERELRDYNREEFIQLREDIRELDISRLPYSQKQQLEEYKENADSALSEENYTGAISYLEVYIEYAEFFLDEYEENLSSYTVLTDTDDEYILPKSNLRYYSRSEILGLSRTELLYARNEIFARHGRRFRDAKIQENFDEKSWYLGTKEPDDVDYNDLNDYEQKNVDLIKKREDELAN